MQTCLLRYRDRAQEIHRAGDRRDAAVLDVGVQDTGSERLAAFRGLSFAGYVDE